MQWRISVQLSLSLMLAVTTACAGPDSTTGADGGATDSRTVDEVEVDAGPDSEMSEPACISDFMCPFGLICSQETCVELPCSNNGHCLADSRICIQVDERSVCVLAECSCASCEACEVGSICDKGTCKAM